MGYKKLPATGADSALDIVTKSAAYTASESDDVILVDTTVAFTLTLYPASGNSGKILTIKKTTNDVNALTIDANASETIDGALTTTISLQYEALKIISDGANWHILERKNELIGFRANNSATAILGTPTKIVWTNTNKDDVAGYSSGTYTVRSDGWYDVTSSLYVSGTPAVDGTTTLYIYRNGSEIKSYVHRYKVASATTTSISIADSFYFNAGDTIEIYAATDMTTPSISSSTTRNIFNVNKIQS